MESKQLLEMVVKAADSRRAEDITALKVDEISPMADYFVIMTGGSDRQVQAIANAIIEVVQDKFGDRELYVGVDCAALLGHPSVMASAVILYPLIVILAVILPGNKMLPIASLAIVPYWCGAVAPQLKGNVFRIVLFVLLWTIPIFLIASAQAPLHTLTMGNLGLADPEVINSSFDMGGDPLGALLIWIFGLFQ